MARKKKVIEKKVEVEEVSEENVCQSNPVITGDSPSKKSKGLVVEE